MASFGTSLVAAVMLVGGCSGPPWFMGRPRSGQPSIPPGTAHPSPSSLHAEAAAEQRSCRRALELRALLALAEREQMRPAESERLRCLLVDRARDLWQHGSAMAAARDLERALDLGGHGPVATPLRAALAVAEVGAGDGWLALGERAPALAAYRAAEAFGASAASLEARMLAAADSPPPADWDLGKLERAVLELPEAGAAAFVQAFVGKGGRGPALHRCARTARWLARPALAALVALRLGTAPPPEPPAAARAAWPLAMAPCDSCAVAQTEIDAWSLGGPSVAGRLLGLADESPGSLAPGPRSRLWHDLLLDEDAWSPDALAVAATIDGFDGRFGGTELWATEMIHHTPDRYAGLVRAARLWKTVGRGRQACATWWRAGRWADDPLDPAWLEVVACTRVDPGAGDWHEVRRYLLDRAPAEARAALEARIDAVP